MKEELITFKTAKLAKEKGFDEKTNASYLDNEDHFDPKRHGRLYLTMTCVNSIDDPFISAPTQSLLQKWLREERNILIETTSYTAEHFTYNLYKRNKIIEIISMGTVNDTFDTYEEALEKGLQEALKLIEL